MRGTFTAAERLAIGQRIHAKEWPDIPTAAAALGCAVATCSRFLRLYRDSLGIGAIGNKGSGRPPEDRIAAKRAYDRERKAALRAAAKSNGTGLTVVAAAPTGNELVATLQARLHAALEEVETLQKLLMTVGRAL